MYKKILFFISYIFILTFQANAQTLIDNFDRTDRLLSVDGYGIVEGTPSIVNNRLGGTSQNAENFGTTPSTYNANMAAFITISVKPEDNAGLSFFTRLNTSTHSGYDIQYTTTSGLDRFRLFQFNNGSFGTQLGSTYFVETSPGDKFGIIAIGTTLTCYYKPAGSENWISIITVTDTMYQSGGSIGFGAYSNVGRYDDLIGGNDLTFPPDNPQISESTIIGTVADGQIR